MEGILTDSDLHVCLMVLQMTDEQLADYREQDSDEADNFEEGSYSLGKYSHLFTTYHNEGFCYIRTFERVSDGNQKLAAKVCAKIFFTYL